MWLEWLRYSIIFDHQKKIRIKILRKEKIKVELNQVLRLGIR